MLIYSASSPASNFRKEDTIAAKLPSSAAFLVSNAKKEASF
jgi:hypothetical protein